MREIKFRGKRIDRDEWIYGFYVEELEHSEEKELQKKCYIVPYLYDKHRFVVPETVGQYTGLKDKKGKMIYEGDIVKFTTHTNKERIGYVQWLDEACAFVVASPKKTRKNSCKIFYFDQLAIVEVIGNIHENPERLREVIDGQGGAP